MVSKDKYYFRIQTETEAVPFENAQEAWFWFIKAQEEKNDGARFVAGQGLVPRPCEPLDILRVLDRLYRQRRLLRDHLLVLRHYGRRQLALKVGGLLLGQLRIGKLVGDVVINHALKFLVHMVGDGHELKSNILLRFADDLGLVRNVNDAVAQFKLHGYVDFRAKAKGTAIGADHQSAN